MLKVRFYEIFDLVYSKIETNPMVIKSCREEKNGDDNQCCLRQRIVAMKAT